ncbi:CsbD family protein [Streptomyces sp. NPDC012888]|uniref:CsbD family protein n=1 Tax=Streptomyces sp. NPDC012888 TaxID=3364855 RepID=UPI00367B04CD
MGKAKAKAEQIKGKLKEAAGHAMGDRRMKAEGKAEQLRGKTREELDRATDDLKKDTR